MKTKLHYSVPEGYFEELSGKLSTIPSREAPRGIVSRLTPYMAMAACFFLSVIIGTAILKKTADPVKAETLAATDQEIIEYLIASDTPLAQIEDFMLNDQ